MNKKIISLLLCFAMIFAMKVTSMPIFADTAEDSTATFIVDADKTTAKPGDTITYTISIQITGAMTCLETTVEIPDGLTYIDGSGYCPDDIADQFGWNDSGEGIWWTEKSKVLNGFGSVNFTKTEKMLLVTFQCRVNDDAPAGDYTINLVDYLADGGIEEGLKPKNPTVQLATVTVEVPHTHELTKVDEKAPTCTEKGNKAYYVCDGCGNWYEDATGNILITDHSSVEIAALGHEYTEKVLDDDHKKETAEDCRSKDTYWYDCSRCEQNAKDDPTATDKWYESENAGPHVYDDSQWGYTCEEGHAHNCLYDDTHDTVVAHNPGAEATEDTPQTCTECGYIIHEKLGHTHKLTKVDEKAPTCTEDGHAEYYYCEECGRYFFDAEGQHEGSEGRFTLSATGHDFEWVVDQEPTETKEGLKHEECKKCGEEGESVIIPATGKKPQLPETGDNSNIMLWIAVMFVSGAATVATTFYSRKRRA